jgi:hypothetical protein
MGNARVPQSRWDPILVLPSLDVSNPLECSLAAFVPADDDRVATACNAHPKLRLFLSRFTDAFRVNLRPTVLLLSTNAPATIRTADAIASFRDVIALSTIPMCRATRLRFDRMGSILYSDSFTYYPWTLDKNYENLTLNTPMLLALHDVEQFYGQAMPEVPHTRLTEFEIDQPLLAKLMERWVVAYSARTPEWNDLALFRSLNMAQEASRAPGPISNSTYDVGRLIALWVSAFEVLIHPGGKGTADLRAVYEGLGRVQWETDFCNEVVHRAYAGRIKEPPLRNAACWLYGELYRLRNMFLHGNPVDAISLKPPSGRANYAFYAAILYRLALTAFLNLIWPHSLPAAADRQARFDDMADRDNFLDFQRNFEMSLRTAWK